MTSVSSPAPRQLQAGPVRLTLANGELRYLYVGQREIVRRLYFCVRFNEKWDTAANEIASCDVTEKDGGFTVQIAVRAIASTVNYGWSAQITGSADGTIGFGVKGAAISQCLHIRRTGLQLLLGADAVIAQPFVMTRPDGTRLRQELQTRVDPIYLRWNSKNLPTLPAKAWKWEPIFQALSLAARTSAISTTARSNSSPLMRTPIPRSRPASVASPASR